MRPTPPRLDTTTATDLALGEDEGATLALVLQPVFCATRGVLTTDAEPARQIGAERAVVLGREQGHPQDLLLQDPLASRRHAVVRRDGTLLAVTDLGSKNGTRVNGRALSREEEIPLRAGDVLRVGGTLLVVQPHVPGALAGAPTAELLGSAPATQRLRAEISSAAATTVDVLVLGESGTGKELVVQEIHRQSGRQGPLLPLNCGAVVETLAESLLFGNVKGVATNTSAQRGLFREAAFGTLFLDEVADLPLPLQAKLLRVLQSRRVLAVGAAVEEAVDVRVIAATHKDLLDETIAGRFRRDLLARLDAFHLRVPALRERRSDILPLFMHQWPGLPPSLSVDLAERLLLHPWPLNVRGLRALGLELSRRAVGATLLRSALAEEWLSRDLQLSANSAPPAPSLVPQGPVGPREAAAPGRARSAATPGALPRVVPDRDALTRYLREHDGKIAAVAERLGFSRRHIKRLTETYQIDLAALRKPDGAA